MKKELIIPAFIFKAETSKNTTKEIIKRQEEVLEIEFPYFEKEEILEIASSLALKKRKAHDRHIDDILEVIDQVGHLWLDPNYDIRKEMLETLPMMTGQSRELCRIELDGTLEMWKKKNAEIQLSSELGGKEYLEDWIKKGTTRIHAQPRGLVMHNMAGNAFNLGLLTLFYGLVTKNVNLIKLSHGEPYVAVRLCESVAEVDKKVANEIAAVYWKGSRNDIYDDLFNSGNVDCVLAWGGIQSIEDIRRRAYRYGIKIIDHGPKLSLSVISEDIFKDINQMQKIAQKIAIDIVCWNQKACLSPRVIYIMDNPQKSTVIHNSKNNISQNSLESKKYSSFFEDIGNLSLGSNYNENSMETLMQRSIKLLKNEFSDLSPKGFAKMLADGLKYTDKILPRANLTHSDGISVIKKREYFLMNHVSRKSAIIINPPMDKLDWTVIFLRELPTASEIDMCQDRFLIITRISSIQDLIQSISKEKLQQYLQTISIYGSDFFVKNVAEELSLIGAYRFPRVGEHNVHPIGMPWDGHYVLQDMIKWVYIGFNEQEREESEEGQISLFKGVKISK